MAYHTGELDQRVTFRREVKTPDGMGGAASVWKDIATVWALVRPLSGREQERAGGLNAEANYLIAIRNRSDLTEADIAVWRDVQFNLREIRYQPRSPWLEIMAEKGVAI